MPTLAKMQYNSTYIWIKFEIWGWGIFKVIQVIVLYIRCSGPVVGSLTVSFWFYLDTRLLGQNTWYTDFVYSMRRLTNFQNALSSDFKLCAH